MHDLTCSLSISLSAKTARDRRVVFGDGLCAPVVRRGDEERGARGRHARRLREPLPCARHRTSEQARVPAELLQKRKRTRKRAQKQRSLKRRDFSGKESAEETHGSLGK